MAVRRIPPTTSDNETAHGIPLSRDAETWQGARASRLCFGYLPPRRTMRRPKASRLAETPRRGKESRPHGCAPDISKPAGQ